MNHSFIKQILSLVLILLVFTPATASALTDSQVDVFNLGIPYFNTEDSTTSGGSGCVDFGTGTLPGTVPAPYNGIFSAAGTKFNVPPAFLAALFYAGEHGSSWPNPPQPYGNGQPWADSHVTGGNQNWPNGEHDGAAGPFQFEYPAWTQFGVDGNGDGQKDVEDLTDASFAAANYLAYLGANTNDAQKLHDAAYRYNGSGSAATVYADNVMSAYAQFSNPGGTNQASGASQSAGGSSCSVNTSLGPVSIIQDGSFGIGDGLMGHQPTMIGLHYTAANEQTVQDVINDLKDPDGSKNCSHITHTCSVQLTVLPDGSIYQLTSRLDVITENIINFNDADIGIEIVGQDEATLLSNQNQFNAVTALVAQLMQKYNIKMVQNFSGKAGLMGHMECDAWSQSHIGSRFTGIYSSDSPAEKTDSHQDPGSTYMAKVRSALGGAGGP